MLLFHGGVSAVPGGFLGVDVFFVLSGYLVTAEDITEREATHVALVSSLNAEREALERLREAERQALDIVMRGIPGYMAIDRMSAPATASASSTPLARSSCLSTERAEPRVR